MPYGHCSCFFQMQLSRSVTFSILLAIVVCVLVTYLASWELLSYICCSKHTLPASLRKLGEFVLVPNLGLVSWKASQKPATHTTICSTFVKQHRKSYRVFFLQTAKGDCICKQSKTYCLYTVYLQCWTLSSSLSLAFIGQMKHWAGMGNWMWFFCSVSE